MILPPRLLLAALLLLPAWCAAGAFSLATERRGTAIEILAVADIRAEPGRAWAVLTAYERYPDFIPDVTTSRVVEREGTSLVVDMAGAVRFMWWRIPVEARLAVRETAPRSVHARMIAGTVRDMEGLYELEPSVGGVRLSYTGRVVLEPHQRHLLDRLVIRLNAARQFGALVDEIERSPEANALPAPHQ